MIAALLVVCVWGAPAENEFHAMLAATDPKDAVALVKLGSWCEAQGRPAWAARCYARAIGLGKGSALGEATVRLAKIELSQKQFQRAYSRLRSLEGSGMPAEAQEILTKATTQATQKQRKLIDDGEAALARGLFPKARAAFTEAYRLAPAGQTSADFVVPAEILSRIARCVDAIDDAYYRETTQPFEHSIQKCATCKAEAGFQKCPRCRGTGVVERTIRIGRITQTVRDVCPRCNGHKWCLCDACRGLCYRTDYTQLTREEWNALEGVINEIRNLNTLQKPLDGALREVEKEILEVDRAAALSFFRAIESRYKRSKDMRGALESVPPGKDALVTAAKLWKETKDVLDRSNLLSSYAIEFAKYIRTYDCLRGTRAKPQFSRAPQATTPPAEVVAPEVLSAFPEEGTAGWVAVEGVMGRYEEQKNEPEKGRLEIQGAVPHNVVFFVWLPAAKPGLERLEQGPWRERVLGLVRAYPFDVREKARAAPQGYQVIVVGRFLRDRLGFPRNWFEVWDLAVGMTAPQEDLFRRLEEPVDLAYGALELGNLVQILRFFDIDAAIEGLDRKRAIACEAVGCPLGIFLDHVAEFLQKPWSCTGRSVALGAAGADDDLSVVLARLRTAHADATYTVRVGVPREDTETVAPIAPTMGSPEERLATALAAMDYETASECYKAMIAGTTDSKARADIERARAKVQLYHALTKKTPVSHLAAAEKITRVTFRMTSGNETTMTFVTISEEAGALRVRMSYGGVLRVNTAKNAILSRKELTRAEWRTEKEAELRALEDELREATGRECVNRLFLLALFCKTNNFAQRGTAYLERALGEQDFGWLLETYFPSDAPGLVALWNSATGREARMTPGPEVATSAQKPPGEFKGEVKLDAPLPEDKAALRGTALALFRDGRRALSESLPGMDNAAQRKKDALARFKKTRDALATLRTMGAMDEELEKLDLEVTLMISACMKMQGFFE